MTTVLMAECSGLWRRTLLIAADGSRDTGTEVAWLQGSTGYVDTRGFAGRLSQRADAFDQTLGKISLLRFRITLLRQIE